jgi:tetratricopeptide (TPR) repeat protein
VQFPRAPGPKPSCPRHRAASPPRWWATYPAENVGDGTIVSDALGFHGFGATARNAGDAGKTYPTELFPEVDVLLPTEQQISAAFAGQFIHIDAQTYRTEAYDPSRYVRHDPNNPIHLFQMYAVTAQGYTAIGEKLLQDPYDLFMIYFEQVDSFSHLFMKYAEPKLEWTDEAEHQRYKDVVTQWYRYQDGLLGRLLDKIDLETTAVFLLSDHGFKSGDRRIHSDKSVDVRKAHLDHETHGVFMAAGPHIKQGVEIPDISVLDVTPTLLQYLGLPVGKDMDGRVAESIFEEAFLGETPIRYVQTYEGGNALGRLHLSRGELDEAEAEFGKARALDPNNTEALLNLGTIKRARGLVAQAERLVEQALQNDPNSIAALVELASIKREQNDLDESIRLIRVALEIDDSQPFVHLALGDSLQRAGKLDEAEQVFRTVLGLDPDSYEAHYNLGVTHLNQQRLDEAVERFEKALELNPRHPQVALAYNNLGDIHLRRGNREAAIESFRKSIDSSPAQFEARFNLATVYLADNRVDEAITLLEEAARIHPNHELVSVQSGVAYLRAGRNQDAHRSFLLVRRLYPQNWIAPLGLAAIMAASDQPDQARAHLEEAYTLGGDAARNEAANWPVLSDL